MSDRTLGRVGGAELRAISVAVAGLLALATGLVFEVVGLPTVAAAIWLVMTVTLLVPLTWSVVKSLARGDVGVDAIALLAMAGSLILGQYLAGAVVAVMLSGGNALEAYAARRARRELSSLLGRAPRTANVRRGTSIEVVAIDAVAVGDIVVVRTGEVVPTDGTLRSDHATLDEAALTGESFPVEMSSGGDIRSGTTNLGAPFEVAVTRPAADSTYASIIRLVKAAELRRAPFERLADRYATRFLAITLIAAAAAWIGSGDPVRALAVLVVATPCPLNSGRAGRAGLGRVGRGSPGRDRQRRGRDRGAGIRPRGAVRQDRHSHVGRAHSGAHRPAQRAVRYRDPAAGGIARSSLTPRGGHIAGRSSDAERFAAGGAVRHRRRCR